MTDDFKENPFGFRYLVVFDTEFTTWPGALYRWWSGPREEPEVVQIGAVKLDLQNGFKEIDHFEVLVKPAVNPLLSDYFSELTGITQDAVERDGIGFPEALASFIDFSKRPENSDETKLASHGCDGAVLARNCLLHGLPIEPSLLRAIDLLPLHRKLLEGLGSDLCSSGELAGKVGADLQGTAHTALTDARSIASFLRHHFA